MTRDEVKFLCKLLVNSFEDLKRTIKTQQDMTDLVDAWFFWLADYDSGVISVAVKAFGTTKGSAFAPTPSQIIAMTHIPQEMSQLTEGEAWAKVMKAICNSTYHAEEEFNKLPKECQIAIGNSPRKLYDYATSDNFNESVVMSNFQRAYKEVIGRKNTYDMLPVEMKKQVDYLSGNRNIELEDKKNEAHG